MTHDLLLDAYARLTVRSGLNISPGQQLLITAPLDAVPLVRRITEHAYRAGASLVTTIYSDDVTTLARYQHAADDTEQRHDGCHQHGRLYPVEHRVTSRRLYCTNG